MNVNATFTAKETVITYNCAVSNNRRELFVARLVFDGEATIYQLVKTAKGSYFIRNLETWKCTPAFSSSEIKANIINLIPEKIKVRKMSKRDAFKLAVYRFKTTDEIWDMGYSAGLAKLPNHRYADDEVYQEAYSLGLEERTKDYVGFTQDAHPDRYEGAISFS